MPGSIDNEFNHTIIRNGNIGIHADSVGNSNPTAIINNTIIENMSSIGIFGQGANLEINNTIVSNCGQYSVACNIGGEYEFTHCTFANYWDFNHRNTPSILLNNFYTDINEIHIIHKVQIIYIYYVNHYLNQNCFLYNTHHYQY